MTKFAEAVTRTRDDSRVREVREYEAGRTERDFAPIRAKARAGADAALSGTGFMAIV
jgi:hypothetical protein